MTNKGEKVNNIRMDVERWQRLTAIAATLVHENELPNGLGVDRNRTGVMLRLIADGTLIVTRPGSTDT